MWWRGAGVGGGGLRACSGGCIQAEEKVAIWD